THAVLKREPGELESRHGNVLGEELPPMGMAGEDEISIPVGPAFRLMDQVESECTGFRDIGRIRHSCPAVINTDKDQLLSVCIHDKVLIFEYSHTVHPELVSEPAGIDNIRCLIPEAAHIVIVPVER